MCRSSACSAGAAWAQNYPTKSVRFIVPQATGGASDVLARIVGGRLAEMYGQQFVVENRPGAGGAIGVNPPSSLVVALGGNALLKWLGEQGDNARTMVTRAAAMALFASGGIDHGAKVLDLLEAGADAVQVYTVLAYRWNAVIKMNRELIQAMKSHSVASLDGYAPWRTNV